MKSVCDSFHTPRAVSVARKSWFRRILALIDDSFRHSQVGLCGHSMVRPSNGRALGLAPSVWTRYEPLTAAWMNKIDGAPTRPPKAGETDARLGPVWPRKCTQRRRAIWLRLRLLNGVEHARLDLTALTAARITALPDFRQSAAASAVTFDDFHRAMPITPNWHATLRKLSPLGCVAASSTCLVGPVAFCN